MSRKHKLSAKEEEEVRTFVIEGVFTRREAAEVMGVSLGLIDDIVGPSRDHKGITQEVRDSAIMRVKGGTPVDSVAAQVGVSKKTLYAWCHAMRLTEK